MRFVWCLIRRVVPSELPMSRGFNGLELYSAVTVERYCICDSLPTVSQHFVNGL